MINIKTLPDILLDSKQENYSYVLSSWLTPKENLLSTLYENKMFKSLSGCLASASCTHSEAFSWGKLGLSHVQEL